MCAYQLFVSCLFTKIFALMMIYPSLQSTEKKIVKLT